jgi:hypothetical protein
MCGEAPLGNGGFSAVGWGYAAMGCARGVRGLGFCSELVASREVGLMDPSPDYDVSDEIEFFFRYLTWGLRGVQDGNGYPPPAYPPV